MHVISGLGTGGAEAMLVQLVQALKARGFEQSVVSVSNHSEKADAIRDAGVPLDFLHVTSMWNAAGGIYRLTRLIRDRKPDVLQGWMYHGDLFAAAANLIVPGSRRLYWGVRASDTVQGGYGWLVRLCARLSRLPELIVANSQSGLDFHCAQGYRPRRAEVIPNGVDIEKFHPDLATRSALRQEFGLPQDAIVAIHVARLDPMKDHATFLKAMRMLPAFRGLLVGAGTETLDLPDNVRALGLRTDVARLYRFADIVVSSSAFAEGFSNILAEGMSCGLVPVATDVGDARLIVGDTGEIVPVRDPDALAQALSRAAASSDLAARKARARARIVENFTLERAVDRFAALYT
jgi:glycosyltransferase involved in cell wall biosynthesis